MRSRSVSKAKMTSKSSTLLVKCSTNGKKQAESPILVTMAINQLRATKQAMLCISFKLTNVFKAKICNCLETSRI